MQTDFDILIIGGGLVGASLACALRAIPLRIAVVEAVPLAASAQPSYDDRTLALAYGSKRIFESMQLWDAVLPEATPIKRIHISDRGHFGITRLSAADAGLPALGYVVANRRLGAALLGGLKEVSQIEWLCPAQMQDIRLTPDTVTATLHHQDKLRTLTAKLIIAADGAHSTVRTALGIEAERTDYCQSAIVSTATVSEPHHNIAYERFTDTGPLALLPLRTHDVTVVWSACDSEEKTILGWNDDEFLSRLHDRFGNRLGKFTRMGKRTAYPLALTRVKEHVRSRLALIGNAAHTVHPVAGQGFNLGLRDVAVLAEILADAVRNGDDIGDLRVLRRYADWRRRDTRITAGLTNGLIRIFSNNLFPFALARNAGLLSVDLLPGIKRGLIRITSGQAGRLPRLARGLPL